MKCSIVVAAALAVVVAGAAAAESYDCSFPGVGGRQLVSKSVTIDVADDRQSVLVTDDFGYSIPGDITKDGIKRLSVKWSTGPGKKMDYALSVFKAKGNRANQVIINAPTGRSASQGMRSSHQGASGHCVKR